MPIIVGFLEPLADSILPHATMGYAIDPPIWAVSIKGRVAALIVRDSQISRCNEILSWSAKVRDEHSISTNHEQGPGFPPAPCLEDDVPDLFFMVRIHWGKQTALWPLGENPADLFPLYEPHSSPLWRPSRNPGQDAVKVLFCSKREFDFSAHVEMSCFRRSSSVT